MDRINLIMIIITILAVCAIFLYYYLNRSPKQDFTFNHNNKKDGFTPVVDDLWQNLHESVIEKKFKPSETGKRNGANQYPPSNSKKLSPTEDKVVSFITNYFNRETNKFVGKLFIRGSKGASNSPWTIQRKIAHHKRIFEGNGYESTFELMMARWETELSKFIKNFKNAIFNRGVSRQALTVFKIDNNVAVGREPQVKARLLTLLKIFVPVILFGVEFYLNYSALRSTGVITADYATYISFIVASINVVLSFFVGYLVITHILNPVDSTKRPRMAFYGPILLIYSSVLIYVNTMMGVFRSLSKDIINAGRELINPSRVDLRDAKIEALNTTAQKSVYPFDELGSITFDGGMLLFLGAFFALVTMIDAYFFKDPIPGYSRVGDDYAAKRKRVEKLKDVDLYVFDKLQKWHDSNLEDKHKTRLNSLFVYRDYIDHLQEIEERYEKFKEDTKELLKTCITNYRTNNSQFRSDPDPEYFGKPIEDLIDMSFLKSFREKHASIAHEIMTDARLEQLVAEKTKTIQIEFDNMIPRYQKYFSDQRTSLYNRVDNIDDEAKKEEHYNE
tara:strand:- start:116 stop:1795 length:1680 start_codon:yes stop_codon:yes gene_type:complete